MEQDKVSRLSDVGKNVWSEDGERREKVEQESKAGFRQKWDSAPKKVIFWTFIGSIVLTTIVGFNWGGWVTGSTAEAMAKDAVVERLASICVGQFDQDPGKEQKLNELKEISSYRQDDYVKEQGWATILGEEKPDSKVADACAKLLLEINQ
jgi:hypothetical protein